MPATPTVLVAGAGVVGLATAALLATGRCADRMRVVVLDARPIPRWRAEDMDPRVYALSRASQQLLAHVGVWSRIAETRAASYLRMRVWEGADAYAANALDFDSADIGEPDLGHIVEDTLLRTVLADKLAASREAQLVIGAEIESVEAGAKEVAVALKDGGRLHGAVLLAADGSDSTVRRLLDLPVSGHRYEQTAVVTHVTSTGEHRSTAWQRFMPGGPLALLPLSDGRSSISIGSAPSRPACAGEPGPEPHGAPPPNGRRVTGLRSDVGRRRRPRGTATPRRWPRPGGPGPAGGGCAGARARSSRPRFRTSRRSAGRTPGSLPSRRSRGRPPSPHGCWHRARGRRGQGRRAEGTARQAAGRAGQRGRGCPADHARLHRHD